MIADFAKFTRTVFLLLQTVTFNITNIHSSFLLQLFCVSLTLFSATGFYLITKLMLKTLSKASFTNKTVDEIVKHGEIFEIVISYLWMRA